jgi:hypothetical protein
MVLLLCFFCMVVHGAPRRGRQHDDDLDPQWRYYLVHGLQSAGEPGSTFVQRLTMSSGAAGPALSEAFRRAARIIPSLADRGALSWPENPAGRDLDQYPAAIEHEIGHLLRGIEDQPHIRAYLTDLEALALLARYHARKGAAARGLVLFEQSGDVAALRSAAANARAAADVWERLTALVAKAPAALFGSENAEYCLRALRVARGDVALIGQVDDAFRRYGLFDAALSFGPERGEAQDRLPGRWPHGRFRLLSPGMSYTRERGFGWQSAQSVRPSGSAGLRGTGRAVLAVDLPDGEYRVISIVANQPELASGSFRIHAGADVIAYEPGETGEKSVQTRVSAGRLEISFIPGSGDDWLIDSLVIARRAPHFGWVPPKVVGSEITVTATITAPDGIGQADFTCLPREGKPLSLPLVGDRAEYTTRVRWPGPWKGKQVHCHFTATDRRGTPARFPASGDFTIEVQ